MGNVYYTGFEGTPDAEIRSTFITWFKKIIYQHIKPVEEEELNPKKFGQSNEIGKSIGAGQTKTNPAYWAAPISCFVALVGIGSAFFMFRRSRRGTSSKAQYTNGASDSQGFITFPVSSNSMNNEYGVDEGSL